MKKLKLLAFVAFYSVMPVIGVTADTDVVVIVHRDNPTTAMTRSQVIDLFMGKYVAFPDGRKARPLDLSGNDDTKKQFYQSLVGMSLARVNSYWSRIKFTGRARPSIKQSTEDDIVNYVSTTEDAIAYVSRPKLTDNLKVVYEFDE